MTKTFQYQRYAAPFTPLVPVDPPRLYPPTNTPVPRISRFHAYRQLHYVGPSPAVLPIPTPTPTFPIYPIAWPNPIKFKRFTTADQQTYAGPLQPALPLPNSAPLFVSAPPLPWTFRRFGAADQQVFAGPAFPTLPLPTIPHHTAGPAVKSRTFPAWLREGYAGMPLSETIAPVMPFVTDALPTRSRQRAQIAETVNVFQQVFAPPFSWSITADQPFPKRKRTIDANPADVLLKIVPQIPQTYNEFTSRKRPRIQWAGAEVIVTINERTQAATMVAISQPWPRKFRLVPDQMPMPFADTFTVPPQPCITDITGVETITGGVVGAVPSVSFVAGTNPKFSEVVGGCTPSEPQPLSPNIPNPLSGVFTSWWRLDEATGLPRSDAAGGVTLANVGNVAQVAGIIAPNASGFNDTDQYVTVADSPSLTVNTDGQISILAWVKLTNKTTDHVIAIKGADTGSNLGYELIYNHTADLIAFSYRANQFAFNIGVIATTFGHPPLDTPLMIVGRYDPVIGASISINNVTDFDATLVGQGIKSVGGPFTIGASADASNFTGGTIGPVGVVVNGYLSDDDIAMLWNNGSGLDPTI